MCNYEIIEERFCQFFSIASAVRAVSASIRTIPVCALESIWQGTMSNDVKEQWPLYNVRRLLAERRVKGKKIGKTGNNRLLGQKRTE